MWPRMRDWKNLARWQRLASEKYKNFGIFSVWGQKMNASTNVNSWKRLQSHANTNRNASHVKMPMSQNPGRVAKLQTEMLEKRSNCAGSLRAAWPSFNTAMYDMIDVIYIYICIWYGLHTYCYLCTYPFTFDIIHIVYRYIICTYELFRVEMCFRSLSRVGHTY